MGLRFWGTGLDELKPVFSSAADRPDQVSLTLEPKDTHHFYYAQLEARDGTSLSPIYEIETRTDVPGNPCDHNRIVLVFDPARTGRAALIRGSGPAAPSGLR